MNTPPDVPHQVPTRGRLLLGSVLLAVLCASALLVTSPGLPMVWDEGDAIVRAERIPQEWQYTTRREGHPAFYGMVIAAGRWVSAGWLRPLDAARFGPMMLFGLAAGAMFWRICREYSAAAAVGAVAALMLLPRMFAHAHFALMDGPLTSCWVLAWAAFPTGGRGASARARWPGAILWGIALGMTFSCKATGWIAPLPFIAWVALYRDRAAARALAVGLPLAAATFFVLNPPLWHDPLHGWVEFFDLNLHRAERLGLNIPIQFLGESHDLGNPLPWYNTLLWTAITVPVGTLLLAAVGIIAVVCRCRADRAGILLVANWLVLLIVRALPMTPPHDGVRLFLPSFAFLAGLAGVGCAEILAAAGIPALSWLRGSRGDEPRGALVFLKRPRFAPLVVVALILIYGGSASSLYWYAPQWLSYYNLLIGGLPGAKAVGMEPTYYWDGLDRSVLDWLHANTEPGEKIRFGAISADNVELMRRPRWRKLERGTQFDDSPGRFRWYVLQHRPGPWERQPVDPWLVKNARPAYRKTIRPAWLRGVLRGWGVDVPRPWRLDVPLMEVYDYPQYLQACEATGRRDIGPDNSP